MRHGTLAGYAAHRCRCTACHAAAYRYEKRRRLDRSRGHRRIVPNTGTVRRLQALMFLGWRRGDIAERAGVSVGAVKEWMRGERITARTAARVAAIYDDMWSTPGPSKITAGKARHLGYVSPLAWDDDTIDDPDATPDVGAYVRPGCDLTPDELTAEVARLTRRGLTAAQIAHQLDVSERTVVRHRSRAA